VKKGDVIGRIRAKAWAIFAGERLFLNLACHLSGVATLTRKYVEAVYPHRAVILDTRKTTPLWRDLERHAVRCGGGQNHRFSLEDAVLIKENHLKYLRDKNLSPSEIYGSKRYRKSVAKFVEIEAQTVQDIWDGLKAGADIVMLDNMTPKQISRAVVLIQATRLALQSDKPLIEVSGRVTVAKARRLAKLGVDRISVGAITHSAPVLDISLEVD